MDLEELRAFLAVADTGSFLTAAKTLRMPRATLRRRIDQLEARAGVLLVDRTRAGATLTEAGKLLSKRGRQMLQESSALLQSVREAGSEPAGSLRILLPVGLPPHVLSAAIGRLRKYPRLSFRIEFSDDPMAGLMENVDLAIHFGETSPVGPWVSRQLLRIRVHAIASRDYLKNRKTPECLEDLSSHTLLSWEMPNGDTSSWPLIGGKKFAVSPHLSTRDIHVIRMLAIEGHGIALVPDAMLPDPGVKEGTLVPILPDLIGTEVSARIVVPALLADVPRIRALIELLQPLLGEFGL